MENNWNRMQVPKKIARVLKMNAKHKDKVDLARQKIIANHFSASMMTLIKFSSFPPSLPDTQAFSVMLVPVLPHAIEWIGRDDQGSSLMYQVSRSVLVPK
jgi:hypothetical protein